MKQVIIIMVLFQFTWASGMVLAATAAQPEARSTVSEDTGDDADQPFRDEFAVTEDRGPIRDPLERINRGIFWFNDKLYFYALKPVARAVRVVPAPIRTSVSNAFHNLAAPIRAANATLQLKFRDAGREVGRFVINSTIGILGLFDPAARYLHLKAKDEDFGQTLGHYGVNPGPYLVLPFLGPSNLRDATGTFADVFADPVYYLTDKQTRDLIAVKSGETVNTLSLDKDTYEAIKQEALDPYVAIRSAYMQHRAAEVRE